MNAAVAACRRCLRSSHLVRGVGPLVRDTYLAAEVLEARRPLVTFYDHCTSSEVPELERLVRTIIRWDAPILRWHRTRLTNAATEGTNLVIKNRHLGVLLEPTTVMAKAWELVAALEGNHGEVRWNPETHLPEGPVTLL